MASDISQAVLTCRLTEDMKVISPKLAALRVAFNSYNGTEEEGNFIDVKLLGDRWQKGIADYLVKGARVAVTGDLREEKWEKDGSKRSKHVILARDIVLLGGKPESHGGSYPAKGSDYTPAATPPAADQMDW